MKRRFFVDVTETYTARIEVMAESPDDAEWEADNLVGGEVVDIVKLALACGPHTDYSKTCEVVPDEETEEETEEEST